MENFTITNNGKALQAKMVAGLTTAVFTRIATSGEKYETKDTETLTELKNIMQTVPVSSVKKTEPAMVEILASVDNSSLDTGYYIQTLGLYAEDGDGNEILFAVSVAGEFPDYMPAFGGEFVSAITYTMNIKVDNSEQVIIEINQAAGVNMIQFEGLERIVNTHTEDTVYSDEGTHGVRYSKDDGVIQVKDPDTGKWSDAGSKVSVDGITITMDEATKIIRLADVLTTKINHIERINEVTNTNSDSIKKLLANTPDKLLRVVSAINAGSNNCSGFHIPIYKFRETYDGSSSRISWTGSALALLGNGLNRPQLYVQIPSGTIREEQLYDYTYFASLTRKMYRLFAFNEIITENTHNEIYVDGIILSTDGKMQKAYFLDTACDTENGITYIGVYGDNLGDVQNHINELVPGGYFIGLGLSWYTQNN